MLDLDFFKKVNDTYGHSAGDAALKSLAMILNGAVEGKSASVGRWGGEEFVIILRNMRREDAFSFADSVRKKVEKADFDVIGNLTCSIGLSYLKKEDSFEDIFDRIDRAMYASKDSGRNKVTEL